MGNTGNMAVLYRISHTSFLQRNNSLCPVDSDGKILLNFSQSECLLAYWVEISNFDRGSFAQAVLEEKVQMSKVNRRRTPSDHKSSHDLFAI
jgi:hypothetical protein